ncbi:MAG: hypothetical protein A2Y10_15285 [Planctomycetes bacterium GWF2_41_51]|nr:MAG: hypothetical protein A2Y10_15285 [Planctomycetes bacterium GWF2_41_51]HBG26964.1 hypothetical protein [Phycisphaerales bacterium]
MNRSKMFIIAALYFLSFSLTAQCKIVSKYNFDTNLLDSGSGLTIDNLTVGAGTPATYEPGVFGTAVRISQSGTQYLLASDSNDLDLRNGAGYTIEAYIKPDVIPTGWSYVAKHWGSTTSYSFGLYDGALSHQLTQTDGNSPWVMGGALTESQWYHIAITVDTVGGNMWLWINGVLCAAETFDGTLADASVPLEIGGNFEGLIDELILHNECKTEKYFKTRTAQLGNATAQAYYKFDSDTYDWASQGVVNDDLTVGAGTSPTYQPGIVGNAVRISSSGTNYLRASDSVDIDLRNGSGYTIEAFVKPVTLPTGWAYIAYHWGGSGAYQAGFYNGVLNNHIMEADGDQRNVMGGNGSIGVWQHIALTIDPVTGTMKTWKNGIEQASVSYDGTLGDTIYSLYVGNNFSDVLIDELILHNAAMDSSYMLARASLAKDSDAIIKYSFENNLSDSAINGRNTDTLSVAVGTQPIYENGIIGKAARLNGSQVLQAVDSIDVELLSGGGPYTIEGFVKMDQLPVNNQNFLIADHWTGSGGYFFGIYGGPTDKVYSSISFNQKFGTIAPGYLVGAWDIKGGVWQHVGVSYDGINRIIWLNGVARKLTATENHGDNTSPLKIGQNFQGLIDELQFHNSAKDGKYFLERAELLKTKMTNLAQNPVPHDKAHAEVKNVVLTWMPGDSAVSHDIYFGTNAATVAAATTASGEYKGNQSSCSYTPGTLELGQTYYWRIDERDGGVYKGDVWSFTVKLDAAAAKEPEPKPFADGVSMITPTLSWKPGIGATSHNVYFGTGKNAVTDANINSPEFKGNQTATIYTLPTLTSDITTYYWRIDEVGSSTIKGDTWSFTVSPYSLDYGIEQPEDLYVVQKWKLSNPEYVLVQSLQGIVAQTRPEIYIDNDDPTYLLYLVNNYGVKYTQVERLQGDDSACMWLLKHYKSRLNGYVLYSLSDANSINVATSLAGVVKGVAVDTSMEASVQALGLSLLVDCRGKNDLWAFNNYWNSMRHNGIVVVANDLNHLLTRDWSPATKIMTMWTADYSIASAILDAVTDSSPCFGWDDPAVKRNEQGMVDFHASKNLYQESSPYVLNLSVHNGFSNAVPPIEFSQTVNRTYVQEDKVHYVAIMYADGDGLQGQLYDWQQFDDPRFYSNPRKGQMAISWGVSPALTKLAPAVISRFYDLATTKDCYYTPYSGMGFFRPSQFPMLTQHNKQLEEYMDRIDQRIILITDQNSYDDSYSSVGKKFAAMDPLRGGILDWPTVYKHRINWFGGRPFVTVRCALWDAVTNDPNTVIYKLNNLPRNPSSPESYSVVIVSMWDYSVDQLNAFGTQLNSNIRKVTVEELIEQMYMNSVHSTLADVTASQDIDVSSTRLGTYGDTNANNNFSERLTELDNGSYSYLEHKWKFNVTGGSDLTITFNVQAFHSPNSENDNFVFAYSTDGVNYIDMLTVTKTNDDGNWQTYTLPNDINGTIYVRAMDTDKTQGNRYLDTLHVDYMFIRTMINDTLQSQDIGAVGIAGEFLDRGTEKAIHGAGSDIVGTSDKFHFAYKQVTGDCTIVARVNYMEMTSGWAKAGVMIRNSLSHDSANIMVNMYPQIGKNLQWRTTTGGQTGHTSSSGGAAPYWIKLVRTGNTFRGYTSSDGTSWTQIGTSKTINMNSTVYIGLAVASHLNEELCLASFDNVSITENLQNSYSPVCGDVNHPFPEGDLDNNCYVNLQDFSMFAEQWLLSGCDSSDWCNGADLSHDGNVRVNDFVVLAAQWLECTDPNPPCEYEPGL